jgi:hypothetical protein
MGVKLSHASQKEHRLTVSGNRVPKRTFGYKTDNVKMRIEKTA